MAETLFDKLWRTHRIAEGEGGADLIAIDRVVLHERTGAATLQALAQAGRQVWAPHRSFCVMDHVVSYAPGRGRDDARMPEGSAFITATRRLAHAAGLTLIDTDDPRQGIVHVVAPELGLALPGLALVCPDSHTCSLGALGALAWGVGSSEAEHALATGTLRLRKPGQLRVTLRGALPVGVYAKDLALAVIVAWGVAGAQRAAVEFAGEAVRGLSLEGRLTLCNMAVEFGAFTAVIAPDETVFDYVFAEKRPFAPLPAERHAALQAWRRLCSDADAVFDRELELDAASLAPMLTWGVSPEHCAPITEPAPEANEGSRRALEYMGLTPGAPLLGLELDGAFIGSCTNGRLEDLRAAAEHLRGRRVHPRVRAVCVPGSKAVACAAEAEGLAEVFRAAGFLWGEPGCAMCFYAGGETFAPGARVVSSTNRNFEGRQGPGVRTHLASPATVAASAVCGRIADPRRVGR